TRLVNDIYLAVHRYGDPCGPIGEGRVVTDRAGRHRHTFVSRRLRHGARVCNAEIQPRRVSIAAAAAAVGPGDFEVWLVVAEGRSCRIVGSRRTEDVVVVNADGIDAQLGDV